jgi:preprotein translocase subunit Sss1
METENLEIINNPLIDEAAKIKKISIVGIVLIFTIIGFFVTIIISIILGIKIISTD